MTQTSAAQDAPAAPAALSPGDTFPRRHLGSEAADLQAMLETTGYDSLEALVDATIPAGIRHDAPLTLKGTSPELGEAGLLERLKKIAGKNQVFRSMIGMGYHGTLTPAVILRSIVENPLWYTPYTPYQAEISQGRLESLLNFQTMVSDLAALPLANASLLDEGTAAAEAMAMCHGVARGKKNTFVVADDCHPQTLGVVRSRAESMGIQIATVDGAALAGSAPQLTPAGGGDAFGFDDICGVLVQYPNTYGEVSAFQTLCDQAHEAGALVVCATDLLSLTLITPPGEWARDVAIGSSQRFGVPMGYGGPHAAYLATREKYARKMPGRIIGVSKDAQGNSAFRLAIQTREQHIKRDRATSNICTAQALLANVAAMYAVYHGPEGLKKIATRVHACAQTLAQALREHDREVLTECFFDTIAVRVPDADAIIALAREAGINLRPIDKHTVGVALDETTTAGDLHDLLAIFGRGVADPAVDFEALVAEPDFGELTRTSGYLEHPVFHLYHTEHELLRYITRLQNKDVSLCQSMIPLGSCTMKLNAAVEMIPITWPEFANLHPYCPEEQAAGYAELFKTLSDWLSEITGFAATSLQPNAGSQGEYAGLMAIREYHGAAGDTGRDICLIPTSAHGTNPASAVIAGMKVVAVGCRENGDIDLDDLRAKAEKHADSLAALMITYPSTHGVFEETIVEACDIIHSNGGMVYMDGANMNAQVGLTSPGRIGADVCHLNLHKTFCIPHGGGGPGMGPICCNDKLAPYLPKSPLDADGYSISAAPFGSAMILPISWVYIALMGPEGLTRATEVAILNANYMAKRLEAHYDILYTGPNGTCAHEFIADCRAFDKSAHVTVEDIAKRLIDFGFHAPTMSWPVSGTLMVEPTESESKSELDRFCDAMIAIRQEIAAIERGELDEKDNPLKHAPHTAAAVTSDAWPHTYPREQAAYPLPYLRDNKYWPPAARIDNAYGDRNLVCTCPPMAEYCEQA